MRALLFAAAAIFASPALAESNGFLTAAEETAIAHRLTPDNIVVVGLEDFAERSETAAVILAHGELHGRPFLLIDRGGRQALAVERSTIDEMEGLRGVSDADPKKVYCKTSCLDDAAAAGFWGSLEGAGKGGAGGAALGGGIGFWIAGPPGAAGGAAMGGTAGAVIGGAGGAAAGGVQGYNTCEKEKAQICGNDK